MSRAGRLCGRCGHAAVMHEHYRRGTDCTMCRCPRWTWSLLDFLRRVARR